MCVCAFLSLSLPLSLCLCVCVVCVCLRLCVCVCVLSLLHIFLCRRFSRCIFRFSSCFFLIEFLYLCFFVIVFFNVFFGPHGARDHVGRDSECQTCCGGACLPDAPEAAQRKVGRPCCVAKPTRLPSKNREYATTVIGEAPPHTIDIKKDMDY